MHRHVYLVNDLIILSNHGGLHECMQLYVMNLVRMVAAVPVLIHAPVPLDGQIQRVNLVSYYISTVHDLHKLIPYIAGNIGGN